MCKIKNILFACIILLATLHLQSCEKKKDTPAVQLIETDVPEADSIVPQNGYPIITIRVKNTGDLNAYNVGCGAVATRHDTVVFTDTVFLTQTYMKPGQTDSGQIWLHTLNSFKQFNHVSYVIFWWDVNSVFYSKSYP